MRSLFYICMPAPEVIDNDSALSDEAVRHDDASGASDARPLMLEPIERICMFQVDYGRGSVLKPAQFLLTSLAISESRSELDLLMALDLEQAFVLAEPGSAVLFGHGSAEHAFCRALANDVTAICLAGELTETGRRFGTPIGMALPTGAQGPSTMAICNTFGIPLESAVDELCAQVSELEQGVLLTRVCEVITIAGWLLGLFYLYPDRLHVVRQNWEALASWIEADPARAHLMAFAKAAHNRRRGGGAQKKSGGIPDDGAGSAAASD